MMKRVVGEERQGGNGKEQEGGRRKGPWGGARPGAGRPRARWRSDPPHRRRAELSPRHPVHVTLRTCCHVPPLRQRRAYHLTRRVLAQFLGRDDFRVVHLSIQDNHFHLLVEASDRRALSRNVQRLEILLAKAINRELGHTGKVFEHRYHDRQIRTARQARNTLSYVLNNWRRHRADFVNGREIKARVDVYSSGVSFDGWSEVRRFAIPKGYDPLPVSPPRTSLLRTGWQWHGRISCYEVPGRPWF